MWTDWINLRKGSKLFQSLAWNKKFSFWRLFWKEEHWIGILTIPDIAFCVGMKWYPLNSVNMTLESRLRWLFGNSNFNRQLYSFIHTYNYNIHDGFHPRIEEPNRGWGRDTNLKKVKEKKKYFTNSNSCRKIRIIVWIKLSKLQCELHREG